MLAHKSPPMTASSSTTGYNGWQRSKRCLYAQLKVKPSQQSVMHIHDGPLWARVMGSRRPTRLYYNTPVHGTSVHHAALHVQNTSNSECDPIWIWWPLLQGWTSHKAHFPRTWLRRVWRIQFDDDIWRAPKSITNQYSVFDSGLSARCVFTLTIPWHVATIKIVYKSA